jgi:hypothetical protein
MKAACVALSVTLGGLTIPACGYAALLMMGFGGMKPWSEEAMRMLGLALLGPISLLPAGLLGIRRPRFAGRWLLAASLGFAILFYGRMKYDAGKLDAWLPLLLCFVPIGLLGAGFLKSAASEPTVPRPRICWPYLYIVPAVAVCAMGLGAIPVVFAGHEWRLVLHPKGGDLAEFRFDDRDERLADLPALTEASQSFFRKPAEKECGSSWAPWSSPRRRIGIGTPWISASSPKSSASRAPRSTGWFCTGPASAGWSRTTAASPSTSA